MITNPTHVRDLQPGHRIRLTDWPEVYVYQKHDWTVMLGMMPDDCFVEVAEAKEER